MKRNKQLSIGILFIMAGLFFPGTVSYAQTSAGNLPGEFPVWLSNPLVYLAGGAMMVLMMVILALAKTSAGLTKVVSRSIRKSYVMAVFLLTASSAFSQSQSAVPANTTEFPVWLLNPNLYIIGFLIIVMVSTIYVLFYVNMKLIKVLASKGNQVVAEKIPVVAVAVKKPGFLRRFYLRMVDSVPVAHEKDILLDHDYDGIKELDNNLPPWWIYGFYVTIIFGVFYMMIYHVSGTGKLQGEEYKDELLLAEKQKAERMKLNADNINEDNVVELADAELVAKGKETYLKLCVACHRPDGGGQVGPNLTDAYWLYGGGIKDIFKTITYGVPNKGMISWKSQLSPKQIQQVGSFILTLKGTNPVGAKEPQGEIWIDERFAKRDSLSTLNTSRDSAAVAVADTLNK